LVVCGGERVREELRGGLVFGFFGGCGGSQVWSTLNVNGIRCLVELAVVHVGGVTSFEIGCRDLL
jgi:hypothetical protein